MKKKIGIVFGTRPDAIKMAPVILELRAHPDVFETVAISTGQHRQMLDQVLQAFEVSADIELDLMRHNQSLSELTRRILEALDALLSENPLDCLLVQGDTTTAFAAALAAFYKKIPVAHVEARPAQRRHFSALARGGEPATGRGRHTIALCAHTSGSQESSRGGRS
jgi:UDP-N-acetylglucosamine 2-epimerase (non-hydrolysing)